MSDGSGYYGMIHAHSNIIIPIGSNYLILASHKYRKLLLSQYVKNIMICMNIISNVYTNIKNNQGSNNVIQVGSKNYDPGI